MSRFALPLLGLLLLAPTVRGQEFSKGRLWQNYNPPGAQNGTIMQEVLSRCDEQGRRTMYDPNPVTYCHEATHALNARIRNSLGGRVNAFYVGGENGLCAILPEPRVTLSTVAQYVPANLRDSTYQLYFVTQARDWQNEPLYILDEWTAYCNGLEHALEIKANPSSDAAQATKFCHFADCVVHAVEQHDPSYSHLAELREFVRWQKGRVQGLLGGGSQVAQQCWGGQCGPQQPTVRYVPKIIQQPQVAEQPRPSSYTDPRWQEWRNQIEVQINSAKCNCDHSNTVDLAFFNTTLNELKADFSAQLAEKDATITALQQKVDNIEIPAAYVPPTAEQQAEAILPHLPPIRLTLKRPDGTIQQQERHLGGPQPLQLEAMSLGIK